MSQDKQLQVTIVPIDSIKPYSRNIKKHTDFDIDILVKSIEAYGFVNPILVQRKTNEIIAGHGRLLAAQKQGLKEVPVIFLELSDIEARGLRIADNKTTENAEWDFPNLADEVADLTAFNDFDLSALGMPPGEIDAIANWTPAIENDKNDSSENKENKKIVCPKCGYEFK